MTDAKVKIEFTVSQTRSLIAYIDLLAGAMADQSSTLYQTFNQTLTSADWMAVARARPLLEAALKATKPKARAHKAGS